MIVIIDCGTGNVGSVFNMLRKLGESAVVSSEISAIEKADRLILPGTGSFDIGMGRLHDSGLIPVLDERVIGAKVPVLGICLGMQLFTGSSEEGTLQGLGWLEARTVKFRFEKNRTDLKVPHMGWNTVMAKAGNPLFAGLDVGARFYFVHSYHLVCDDESNVTSRTCHGYEFVSSVQKGNITGVQFHPEKSHKFGLRLLKNFVGMGHHA
ncbi:MAG: imidazole glycerol phosphate synthase subunit HisH [Nitrospirota bacterium]